MYQEINLSPRDHNETIENIILEKIQTAFNEVTENLADINTDYKIPREIKLSVRLKMKDETREKITVSITSRTSLAPARATDKIISLANNKLIESVEENLELFEENNLQKKNISSIRSFE